VKEDYEISKKDMAQHEAVDIKIKRKLKEPLTVDQVNHIMCEIESRRIMEHFDLKEKEKEKEKEKD
jgi:hypothetical protein